MKILKTVNSVPGGLMVVPLFLGMVLNTFFPDLLRIGGFTQALTGVGYPTVLGMYLFTVGTKMTFRAAPRMLLRGGGILVAKVGTATLFALAIAQLLRRQRARSQHARRDGGDERYQRRDVSRADERDGQQGRLGHLRRAERRDRPVPDDADFRRRRPRRHSVADDAVGDRADSRRRGARQPRRRHQAVLRFARADHRAVHGVHARPDDQSAGRSSRPARPASSSASPSSSSPASSASSRTNCWAAAASPARPRRARRGIRRRCRKAVAMADTTYVPVAEAATVQVAASVIVTAILTPLLTSWWYKRVIREEERKAAAGGPPRWSPNQRASREVGSGVVRFRRGARPGSHPDAGRRLHGRPHSRILHAARRPVPYRRLSPRGHAGRSAHARDLSPTPRSPNSSPKSASFS